VSPVYKRKDSTLDFISPTQYLKSQQAAVVLHVNENAFEDTEV